MKNILYFWQLFESKKEESPQEPYQEENRVEMDLAEVKKTKEYRKILSLGFKEVSSDQQELNSSLKFIRTKNKQREKGYGDVFYTVHPTGSVRRYNPKKNKDGTLTPGSGNDLKKFPAFKTPKSYKKALDYLYEYLLRKQERGDFR
jgi:hypothetical protein